MTHGLFNGRERTSSNCMRNLRSTQKWTKQIKIKKYIYYTSVLYHLITNQTTCKYIHIDLSSFDDD